MELRTKTPRDLRRDANREKIDDAVTKFLEGGGSIVEVEPTVKGGKTSIERHNRIQLPKTL